MLETLAILLIKKYCTILKTTHITKRDFMPARNSGTSPVKLLFDKSLKKHL